jgi:hypothetical protein
LLAPKAAALAKARLYPRGKQSPLCDGCLSVIEFCGNELKICGNTNGLCPYTGDRTLHPVQADMQAKLTKALSELREGVAATKRMLLERTEMREDDDGQFRSIREPSPRGALTGAKVEKKAMAQGAT